MEQEPCHIYYYRRLWQGQTGKNRRSLSGFSATL